MTHYTVLYNGDYGGFKISEQGCRMILEEFPDKGEVLFGKDYEEDAIYDGSRSDVLRDDQDIIQFMVKKGLALFQDRVCKLRIAFLPIYENIRIDYKIKEYDGRESILLNIPYEEIAKDLADNTYKNPLTKYIKERGFDTVISKIKH